MPISESMVQDIVQEVMAKKCRLQTLRPVNMEFSQI